MANTEQYNKLKKRIEQLEYKSCCPKIVYVAGGEFTFPGKEGILYVNTTNKKIYLWSAELEQYDSFDDTIVSMGPP